MRAVAKALDPRSLGTPLLDDPRLRALLAALLAQAALAGAALWVLDGLW